MMKLASIMVMAGILTACAGWRPLTTDEIVPSDTMARVDALRAATPEQKETFGVLAGLAGRTYRGQPTEDSSETLADIQHWSWTENGTVLQVRHALEDGSYGGTTIIRPGEAPGELTYVYETSTGSSTVGTYTLNTSGGWQTLEEVGGAGPIQKVRSRGYIAMGGAMITESDYFADGKWVPGHGFVYEVHEGEVPQLAGTGR